MHVDIIRHKSAGAALVSAAHESRGQILRVNHALAALLASTPDALVGTRMCDHIHPADRTRALAAFLRLICGARNSYEGSGCLLASDGETHRVSAFASLLTAGASDVVLIRFQGLPPIKPHDRR
jgi:PAS domain-containing protein